MAAASTNVTMMCAQIRLENLIHYILAPQIISNDVSRHFIVFNSFIAGSDHGI